MRASERRRRGGASLTSQPAALAAADAQQGLPLLPLRALALLMRRFAATNDARAVRDNALSQRLEAALLQKPGRPASLEEQVQ